MVKVRFAPSPTGNLHIGSVRTALFNYLFARHHGGKFVLRIEDTDLERSRQEYTDDILSGLEWLSLSSAEPPVYQNSRRELHLEYVDKLLQEGRAYPDPEGSPAVFFRVPADGETVIHDLVKGDIVFQNKDFKDQVIRKSDGSATYNFAVVLDDALMGITHIIRGEDHISNTPKQIFLYNALGFALPQFAHIPMILGTDRSKLSKRHGATSINEYKKSGFLPEAIVNYLALLGWTPADGAELMSLAELCQKFDLDRVSKSNSIFDLEKLRWLNAQKLKNLSLETLQKAYPELDIEILKIIKDDLVLLTDVPEKAKVFTLPKIEYTDEQKTELKTDSAHQVFRELQEKIDIIYSGAIEEQYGKAQALIDDIVKNTGLKKGQVFHPLRVALTAQKSGPGLKFLLVLLGREKVKERIQNALGC
ncbi:glutamyl-tRNA synthetases [Candidatus Termititenax aidoneus]|uniref:Glutamate--tRNA ligase n=1 Tax=Termititenax aidoneus TaxID=2218524 RepID=A0A388TBX6_TERA1|nr:glutamyl-tRNA synthetases [Candidatus Termititenax aidoneus]